MVGILFEVYLDGLYRYEVWNRDVGVVMCQRVEHYKTYALREYFDLNDPTPCN